MCYGFVYQNDGPISAFNFVALNFDQQIVGPVFANRSCYHQTMQFMLNTTIADYSIIW